MAETFLRAALLAVQQGGDDLHQTLDTLPAPVYLTNADGVLAYFNRACVDFAGRQPRLGNDRWCVTWKLFTDDGGFLPHEKCPMAIALQEQRPVRGIEAITERPDGTRRNFQPYPTPLFSSDGNLIGGLNLFIDTTAMRQSLALREQSLRCRRLAATATDLQTMDTLNAIAAEYEDQARAIDNELF